MGLKYCKLSHYMASPDSLADTPLCQIKPQMQKYKAKKWNSLFWPKWSKFHCVLLCFSTISSDFWFMFFCKLAVTTTEPEKWPLSIGDTTLLSHIREIFLLLILEYFCKNANARDLNPYQGHSNVGGLKWSGCSEYKIGRVSDGISDSGVLSWEKDKI